MVDVSKLLLTHPDPLLGKFSFLAGALLAFEDIDGPKSLDAGPPVRCDVAVFFVSKGTTAAQIESMISFVLDVNSPLAGRILVDNGCDVCRADKDWLVGDAVFVKIRGRPARSGITGDDVTVCAVQPAPIPSPRQEARGKCQPRNAPRNSGDKQGPADEQHRL